MLADMSYRVVPRFPEWPVYVSEPSSFRNLAMRASRVVDKCIKSRSVSREQRPGWTMDSKCDDLS